MSRAETTTSRLSDNQPSPASELARQRGKSESPESVRSAAKTMNLFRLTMRRKAEEMNAKLTKQEPALKGAQFSFVFADFGG